MSYVLTKMTDIIEFNPRETIARKQVCKKVPMEYLQPFTRQISGFEEAPYAGGTKFRNNDTIMARITPCLENGKTAFVKGFAENEVVFGSTEYIVMRAIPGASDSVFIYYLATSPSFREVAIKSMVGSSGRQRVQQDVLENLELVLPDYETQVRVGKVLSAFDDKIELNTQINHNLEEQAKAIFKSWFVDFEPFNGKMPKSWLAKTLADVSKIGAGGDKPHCVSEIQTPEFQYPIYSNGLANDGLYGYASSAKIYEESITVSARGTIGFVCLRQEPYVPIVRLITLIPNTCFVSAKYLYLYLKGINISGTGTTQQQLTVPDFQKTSIMVPDNDTMKRFTICADSIFEQIKHNAKEMRTLAQLRDTLLPKLMSGEIDVSEVEV